MYSGTKSSLGGVPRDKWYEMTYTFWTDLPETWALVMLQLSSLNLLYRILPQLDESNRCSQGILGRWAEKLIKEHFNEKF